MLTLEAFVVSELVVEVLSTVLLKGECSVDVWAAISVEVEGLAQGVLPGDVVLNGSM